MSAFEPYWVLDFDNDPNYADNHNFGWTCVVSARTHTQAWKMIRANAESASLLPDDITPDSVRRATLDDVGWYEGMCGALVHS